MNRIAVGPVPQFLGRLAEIFQDLPVEELKLPGGADGTDEPGNAVDKLAEITKGVLRSPSLLEIGIGLARRREFRPMNTHGALEASHPVIRSLVSSSKRLMEFRFSWFVRPPRLPSRLKATIAVIEGLPGKPINFLRVQQWSRRARVSLFRRRDRCH
jgi:hypothetical protein